MNYPESSKRFLGTVTAKILRLSWFLGVFAGTALIGGGMQVSAQEWEQVSAAAKREGRVIVSGPTGAIVRGVLTTEFQAKFPEIHVEFSGLRGSQAGPRILTELRAGHILWDIFIGGLSTSLSLRNSGALAELRPALMLPEVKGSKYWHGGLDFGFLDKEKKYLLGFFGYVAPIAWVNRKLAPSSQLSKVRQLVDPQFSGKILIQDPRGSGPGSSRLAGILLTYGEDFVKKLLAEQKPILFRNFRQAAEWVVRGRYPIVVGLSPQHFQDFWREGLGKEVKVLPTDIKVLNVGAGIVSLFEGAPHPNAAKVYINWLLSKGAQELLAKAVLQNSRRTDVAPVDLANFPKPDQLDKYILQIHVT